MPEIPVAGFALEALGAIALALMLTSLDRERHGAGVRHWALGQWALAAGLAASVAVSRAPAGSILQAALRLPAVVLAYWSPALVLLGTWARWNGRLPPRATRLLLAGLALLGATTSLASPLAGSAAPLLRSGTRSALTSIAHACAGALLLRGTRRRRLFGARVLAASFFGAALEDALFLGLVVARTAAPPAIARPELLIQFELLLLFLSGVGMVAWLLEDERETALQLERALRRRQALAEMGTLVAGVAHEARNPLFGISATLDALHARLGESAADRHLALMREEIARLSRLMGDLLDYGRPIAAGARAGLARRRRRDGRRRSAPPRARPPASRSSCCAGRGPSTCASTRRGWCRRSRTSSRTPSSTPRGAAACRSSSAPRLKTASLASAASCATRGRASARRTWPTCSSRSTAAGSAARASACRSCSASSTSTGAA